MPWGTHSAISTRPGTDLLETLIPFFKAGSEAGEFCAWVISEPLTEDGSGRRGAAVPRLHQYGPTGHRGLAGRDVYLAGGEIDLHRIIGNWNAKLEDALSRGYPGTG